MTILQAIALLMCFASGLLAICIVLILVFIPFALWSGEKLSRGALAGNSSFLLLSLGIFSIFLPLATASDSPVANIQYWLYFGGLTLLIAGGFLLRKAIRA